MYKIAYVMQQIDLDSTDRRILEWLQKEPGINASELGEKIGLSQSAVWQIGRAHV